MAGYGPKPKAILFDIGGVCVLSPMQAILDYESQNNIPKGWINVAISGSKPNGAWHRMERGEISIGKDFYGPFARDLSNEKLWQAFCARVAVKAGAPSKDIPSVPQIDTEKLVDAIITISRNPDPNMYPALKKLKASGKFVIGALSNTFVLSDEHWANEPPKKGDPRTVFDPKQFFEPFVSSAHAGVRKPEMRAYQVAYEMMQAQYRREFGGSLKPEDIVFLDDIGENLKQGKVFGFQTIKVLMGNTIEAVKELERMIGTSLIEDVAKL